MLISIGIPTRNRASELRRAIDSVLAQDVELELIISDNASEDETQAMCRALQSKYREIRYYRQPCLVRPSENFVSVLRQAGGEYFMWLGDDDWLGRDYLRCCRSTLQARPDLVGVVGRSPHYRGDIFLEDSERASYVSPSPGERILTYFREVRKNAVFYGLFRRHALSSLNLRDTFGGDWRFVAALLMQGGMESIDSVTLNRTTEGISADFGKLLASYGWAGFRARHPWLILALLAASDIAWREPAYDALGVRGRSVLAYRAYRVLSRGRGTSMTRALRGELRIRSRLRRLSRSLMGPAR